MVEVESWPQCHSYNTHNTLGIAPDLNPIATCKLAEGLGL